MRHTTHLDIDDDTIVTEGMATTHKDGVTVGHVAMYLDGGTVTVSSSSPAVLSKLAASLAIAADELSRKDAKASWDAMTVDERDAFRRHADLLAAGGDA